MLNFVTMVKTYGPVVIAACAAAAAALPPAKPGTFWAVGRQIINVLACNFGNAKNAQ